MELLLIVGGLALLGLASVRFGHDSRELEGAAPWHSWRDEVARGRAGVPAQLDWTVVEAAYRSEELRLVAARERMVRPRRASVVRGLGAHRAAIGWVGAAMVRAGERLQSYGRRAAPGW
jgi:hypothetical protein